MSIQARSVNFKIRMNSALDSKPKALTNLTVEPLVNPEPMNGYEKYLQQVIKSRFYR